MSFMKFSKGKKIKVMPNGIGEGAFFDGSTYAKLTCQDLPIGTNPTSISVWFYQKSGTGLQTICGYGDNETKAQKFIMTNFPYIYSHGWYSDVPYEQKEIVYNKWYHVVFVYENAIEKVYLNGEFLGQRDFEFNTSTSNFEFRIGTQNDDRYFNGNIANLQVFNRALSANEITQLYNKQEITSGRVLYVPLQYGKDDESMFTSKNFVYDYSTLTTSSGFDEFGYPIRYDIASECGINYATIPTDNLILYMALKEFKVSPEIVDSEVFSTNYEGNYNSANYQTVDNVPCLYLDSNSNITLTRGNKEIRQATFAYWGKFNDSSQCIITNSYDTSACVNGGAEFWLAFSATNAYFTSGSADGNIIYVDISISPEWHHIAVTWDMDTNYMYLYLDGELIGECTDQSWLAPNINRSGFILSVNNLYRASSIVYGNGDYSNVRMYDRVLTANEIKALAREF